MEQTEIEQLVEEAETRVERLRSLYDQYFMGIERIEPQIARKDVERRIQILRRTQIRNTALRFRFQNILLRYNTFSAHWMRICRQIEDGTYKHHLRKATARFGVKAEAKQAARDAKKKAETTDSIPPPSEAGFDVDFDEGLDGGADDDGLEAGLEAAFRAVVAVSPPVPAGSLGKAPPPLKPPVPVPGKPPPVPVRATVAPPPLPGRAAPPPVPGRPPIPGPPRLPPNAPPLPPRAPSPSAPTLPAVAAPRPVAPTAPANLPRAVAAAPARPAPAPAPPAPAPKPAPKAPVDPSSLSDERVRQLYSKYVETRRSLKESTAAITMDSMAKSLRDSSEKLRQKHGGRNVDFEVQVKDGKTVLKPIVK